VLSGEVGEVRFMNIVKDSLGDSGEDLVDNTGVGLAQLTVTLLGQGFYIWILGVIVSLV